MSGIAQPVRLPARGRGYDGVAKSFHWLIVLLLVVQYLTEWLPHSWISDDTLTAWHLSVGPTILALMLLRLLWRLTHRPPPAPTDLATPLQLLSRATHWLFYAILVVLPLMGWTAASAYGSTPYLLGIMPLPALTGKDKDFAEAIGDAHGTLALVLLAIIALHVAGALYHALVKHDGVMQRMLPGRAENGGR